MQPFSSMCFKGLIMHVCILVTCHFSTSGAFPPALGRQTPLILNSQAAPPPVSQSVTKRLSAVLELLEPPSSRHQDHSRARLRGLLSSTSLLQPSSPTPQLQPSNSTPIQTLPSQSVVSLSIELPRPLPVPKIPSPAMSFVPPLPPAPPPPPVPPVSNSTLKPPPPFPIPHLLSPSPPPLPASEPPPSPIPETDPFPHLASCQSKPSSCEQMPVDLTFTAFPFISTETRPYNLQLCFNLTGTFGLLAPYTANSSCTRSVVQGGLQELRIKTRHALTSPIGLYVNGAFRQQLQPTGKPYISVPLKLGMLPTRKSIELCLDDKQFRFMTVVDEMLASGPSEFVMFVDGFLWYTVPVSYSLVSKGAKCCPVCTTSVMKRMLPPPPPLTQFPPQPPGGLYESCVRVRTDTSCTAAAVACGFLLPQHLSLFAKKNFGYGKGCVRCANNPSSWCGTGRPTKYCCAV